jgi:CRISPR-associated endonuclease/helicase Cas3
MFSYYCSERVLYLTAKMDYLARETPVFLAHADSDGRSQLLRDHLASVSQAARTAADKIGLGAAGAMIGLMHDLGKYSRDFQRYLRQIAPDQDTEQQQLKRGSVDHSTAGAQRIWRGLREKGRLERVVGEILSICVASHHSGLIDCLTPSGTDNLSRRMEKADAESHFDEAWANADRKVIAEHGKQLEDARLVGGIREIVESICQSDGIPGIQKLKVGLVVRFLFSCLIDADRTNTADFSSGAAASLRQRGQYAEWPALAALLEDRLTGFSARSPIDELRGEVSAACLSAAERPKGTYLLTVPTGGGKTLASLRFALHHAAKWDMDRVIYVSPYTSIIDQNAKVVRDILEPHGTEFASVVLEHHSNLTPLEQTWKSKILSENWDAPVVFTTAVQFLEGLFGPRTRGVRRMHAMARSVLIFDEIQTVPVRCVHLMNNALNFLVEQCGSTVVLCTATQPLLHEVDPGKGALRLGEDAEIMRDVPSLFGKVHRYDTFDRRKPGGWGHDEAAQLAIDEMRRAASCLVVVNTKREALSIFTECQPRAGEAAVYHLSTGMCPAHRMKVLEEIKPRLDQRAPTICVSTQLIEAGVDISFGSAIRALAGLDSITQVAGRCNRHGERDMGQVHLVNLRGEVPKVLREIRAAQETGQRVLDENACNAGNGTVNLSDPRLIALYFRYYFFDRRQEMDYPVGPDQAEREDTLLGMLSENGLAVAGRPAPPPIYLRQAFMTAAEAFEAIDSNTRGVVVPYGAEGQAVIGELCSTGWQEKRFALLKRAQLFTVNVFPYLLAKLQEAGAVRECQEGTGILYLDEKYYNADFGLNVEGTEEMELRDA